MISEAGRLCVCLTPLHVLIAARVAAALRLNFSQGVYLVTSDHPKHRHYFERMKNFCDDVDYHVLPEQDVKRLSKHIGILTSRFRALRRLRQYKKYGEVYAPSSVSQNLFALLSAVNFSKLITFDDGLLNIHPKPPSIFAHTNWTTKIFLIISGIFFWPERVRKISSLHYTIYDLKNASLRTSKIELFPSPPQEFASLSSKDEEITIFIGPYPEANQKTWQLVKDAIDILNPNYYIPHPRENKPIVSSANRVDTNLIAEDFILQLREKNQNIRINVYGHDTTVLANLAEVSGIKTFNILSERDESEDLRELYVRLGVNLVEPGSRGTSVTT